MLAMRLRIPRREYLERAGVDFGHIALLPVVVRPRAVRNFAFHVELHALAYIQLLEGLGRLAPDGDVVPFGKLLLFAVIVAVFLGGGEGEAHALLAVRGGNGRVFPDVADKHCFVQIGHIYLVT